MQTTDSSVVPTEFFSVENTWDGNWNKNVNDTNYFFSINVICISRITVSIFKFIFTLNKLMAIISDKKKHVTVARLKFMHYLQ